MQHTALILAAVAVVVLLIAVAAGRRGGAEGFAPLKCPAGTKLCHFGTAKDPVRIACIPAGTVCMGWTPAQRAAARAQYLAARETT